MNLIRKFSRRDALKSFGVILVGLSVFNKKSYAFDEQIMEENNNKISFFTTDDGCKIAYKIDGDSSKPVLILANSIATNLQMWDGQVGNFSKDFKVVRFDTRGNGLSDAPLGDYSIDRMALDVVELLDYLKIEQSHFCGLSLGGFIGQWLGIHASERINKLILVNTSPYLGPQQSWNKHIHKLRNDRNMESFEEMFISGWFPKDMIENKKDIVSLFRKMIRQTSPTGLAGSFAAVRDADFRKTNILTPNKTLIIAGKYDAVTKPEHSEAINSAISDSELIVLPATHLTNVERKDEFERLVVDFLKKGYTD